MHHQTVSPRTLLLPWCRFAAASALALASAMAVSGCSGEDISAETEDMMLPGAAGAPAMSGGTFPNQPGPVPSAQPPAGSTSPTGSGVTPPPDVPSQGGVTGGAGATAAAGTPDATAGAGGTGAGGDGVPPSAGGGNSGEMTGAQGGTSGATSGALGGAGGSSADPGGTSTGSEPAGENACSDGVPADGFYVSGGKLYDNRCNEFVIRGVNYPYAWYSSEPTEQHFADIASFGANAVRVVLATGGQWPRVDGSAVSSIIEWAKSNELVAILEVHDSTGWAESEGAVHPDAAVEYWLSSDVLAAITGNEAYVIINIANEPFGNDTTEEWEPFHVQAVQDLRAGGVQHTLMVDAPNWGQDWTATMLDGEGAPNIFMADPNKNVVFSVHMYDVYWDSMVVDDYFNVFLMKGVPLVVGEFAADHGPDKEVAEDAIINRAEELGIGYMGWSWAGNNAELSSLDITMGFDAGSLTPWGERLLNGENGIGQTGRACSCFD